MTKKFFEEEQEENNQEEPEKIKLGESEFTAEELESLVGKAKAVKEFEEKQGQTWDEVTKSWGKRGERIGELKKKVEEYETKVAEIEKPQEVVDQEKLKEQVIAEAKQFGLLTKQDAEEMMQNYYQTQRTGERMLTRVKKTIRSNKRDGYPDTSAEELLKFMADPENPKNPEKAYKLMFEKEIDEIKQKKLQSIKKPNMVTNEKSTAGGKEFNPPEITKDNLRSTIREHFRGSQ